MRYLPEIVFRVFVSAKTAPEGFAGWLNNILHRCFAYRQKFYSLHPQSLGKIVKDYPHSFVSCKPQASGVLRSGRAYPPRQMSRFVVTRSIQKNSFGLRILRKQRFHQERRTEAGTFGA